MSTAPQARNPPTRPVVLFDGNCGFCTAAARWGERRWPGVVEVMAWQHADLELLGLDAERCATELQFVEADGAHAGGARAIGRWLRTAGGIWKPLGWLCLIPPTSWIAACLYKLVVANRRHLPGIEPACRAGSRDC
jgi:predicted DCC family thiol-disulfide oxidoreductase YuxK